MSHSIVPPWLLRVIAVTAFIVAASASVATAGVIFHDDFESPLSSATYWPETSDNDPTTPVVGQPWVVVENVAYYVQEVRHQQFLPGDPYPKASPPPPSIGYPSFAAASGQQYLHQILNFNNAKAWIQFSPAEQALIASYGKLRLDTKVFALSGHDSWHGSFQVIGWDSAPETLTNRAFDVSLIEGGYGADGTVVVYNGVGNVTTPQLHRVNRWQHLVLDVDFVTDTYTVNLDGVVYSGVGTSWLGNLSKIQSISLSPYSTGTNFRIGLDDVFIYVPEPASAAVLTLVGVVLGTRRRWR